MIMIFCSVPYYFSYMYFIHIYVHVFINLLKQYLKKEKLDIYFKKDTYLSNYLFYTDMVSI